MREILFRGKRKFPRWRFDNIWVDGYLLRYEDGDCDICSPSGPDELYKYSVHPSTVGEFTGLTDKNGVKIFEGDIIRYNTSDDFDCHSVVKLGEYEQDGSGGEYAPRRCIGWYAEVDNFTCPDWAEDDPSYFSGYLKQQNLLEVSAQCEVIGNIHDQPELISEGEA